VEELNSIGLNPKFYQLDVESIESINGFKEFLKENYGGIDVLVNNAGVFLSVNY
jgi:NAD(P)-dependent dehydrogenase (short-subunit alcohol dehydrogenase family)